MTWLVWTGLALVGVWVAFAIGLWFGLSLPRWAERWEQEEDEEAILREDRDIR